MHDSLDDFVKILQGDRNAQQYRNFLDCMSAHLGVNHSLRKRDIRPQPRHISCEVPQQHESQRLAEIQDTANEASQKTKQ